MVYGKGKERKQKKQPNQKPKNITHEERLYLEGALEALETEQKI